MDLQIVDDEEVTEPIELAEVKAYLQIDADYSVTDGTVMIAMMAARKRLEEYLNIGLVKRSITVYWPGHEIELPKSPTGEITSVSKNGDELTADDYRVIELPAKRIAVNSACNLSGDWFYSITGGYVEFTPDNSSYGGDVYSCVYETGYESIANKGDLKQALLAEISHIYKLRGEPVTDLISPNAAMLAGSYSRNLII